MEENILISVIVPAYNVASWLPKCLDSILSQTYHNIEIIVVDDGATDQTPQIADNYAQKDKRVVVIHQPNGGLVDAREKGIELAKGEYVGFVDGDDAIRPDMYERLLKNALKYNADISHCGVSFCFSDGRIEEHYGTGKVVEQDNFTGVKDLLEGTMVEPSLCNKLYKPALLCGSCIDRTVLNNEDLLRNFTLFSRAKKSIFEDFCGYLYMQREGSMSKDTSKYIQSSEHMIKSRRLILDNSTPEVYPYAMRLWLSTFVNIIQTVEYSHDPDLQNFGKECKKILKKERKNIRYLIRRQQIAAYLLLYFPAIHKLVYSIYKK